MRFSVAGRTLTGAVSVYSISNEGKKPVAVSAWLKDKIKEHLVPKK